MVVVVIIVFRMRRKLGWEKGVVTGVRLGSESALPNQVRRQLGVKRNGRRNADDNNEVELKENGLRLSHAGRAKGQYPGAERPHRG